MTDFFKNIKYFFGIARFKLVKKTGDLFFPRKIVWSRSACFGQEIFGFVYGDKNFKLVNMQKARVDLLLDWTTGRSARPNPPAVKPYLKRLDVYPFIKEQAKISWTGVGEEFAFLSMDSYAELTDQKFTHKAGGWSFCCHWSDMNHEGDFDAQFVCEGLMPVDRLELAYENFFSWFFSAYPNKTVYFIHYPSKLDNREEFKQRGATILRILTALSAKYPQIKNLSVPENLVDYNELDRLPYHYSKKTNLAMAQAWQARI